MTERQAGSGGGPSGPDAPAFLDVEVWAIPLRQPPDTVMRLADLLDPQECRLAENDLRYAVAHGAARRILAAQLGCAAHELRRTLGPHGKPSLVGVGAGLSWNLSASGDWALLALLPGTGSGSGPGPDTGPPSHDVSVGIDVERLVPPSAALRLARRYYPEPEAQLVHEAGATGSADDVYTRLWTYKEAYVKAHGGRLMEGLPVRVPAGPSGLMSGSLGGCWVAEVRAPAAGYRAAVAVTGPLPPRPRPRVWEAARAL